MNKKTIIWASIGALFCAVLMFTVFHFMQDKTNADIPDDRSASGYRDQEAIDREKQEFLDWLAENPQTEMNTPDAELLQHVQEVTQAYEQKLAKDDENDRTTYNIYAKYTGESLTVVLFGDDWDADLLKMNKKVGMLQTTTVTYVEFETIISYFIRRIDRIDERTPELRGEMERVLEPLLEYHQYEYIPDGWE